MSWCGIAFVIFIDILLFPIQKGDFIGNVE